MNIVKYKVLPTLFIRTVKKKNLLEKTILCFYAYFGDLVEEADQITRGIFKIVDTKN